MLCLAGEKDPNAPAAGGGAHGGQDPGARYVCLPGVGHLPNLEAPAAFDAAVLRLPAERFDRAHDRPLTSNVGTTADAPIFDPAAFRLEPRRSRADRQGPRSFGARVLAPRAAQHDREATFPIENFRDMHPRGPARHLRAQGRRRVGASFRTYCLAAAELGRYCGATALSWNMHVCSTLWTGALADDLEMSAEERAEHNARRRLHYKRIVGDGAIYSQPFSEGGAAAAGAAAFGTEAKPVDGGFLVSGKKIFASLSGAADYYGVLCTERGEGDAASRRNTLYLAIPAKAEGVSVVGDWDPLGMRGTVSRTLLLKDVFVPEDEMLMPRGVYFRAATSWPHMFLTLSPTYMGLAQAAYDFTVAYLRGELPGTPPVKRRMYPDQADRGGRDAHHAGADQGAVVPGRQRGARRPDQGAGAARLRGAVHGDGERQRARRQGHPHLRRAGHAEEPRAGAHLSRQPLRLADAAVDGGDLPRPHRERGLYEAGETDDVRQVRAERGSSFIEASAERSQLWTRY